MQQDNPEKDWVIAPASAPVSILEAAHLFDDEVTDDAARDFLARSRHVLLIARDRDNHPIGFVTGVEMRHPDKEPEVFVCQLGVDDDWRRQGVATALLEALEEYAAERGCRGLWTGTERDNAAALATYRGRGGVVEEDSVIVTWDELPDDAVAARQEFASS